MLRSLSLVCAGALVLSAQQGRVSGPVSGFVFDGAAHALRPVLGIPGASLMGQAVDLGVEARSAWVAPRQDSAIVLAADGSTRLYRLDAGAATARSIDGALLAPEQVVYSPSGTAAVLRAGSRIQVIKGLPDSASAGAASDAGMDLGARPLPGVRERLTRASNWTLALSDDGDLVLAANGGQLQLFKSGDAARQLIASPPGAPAAFAPGTHDAAVLDDASNLVLFTDLTGQASRRVVAGPDDALASASGVAFSIDGQTIYVASSGARGVIAFRLADASRSTFACNCVPAALVSMGSAFRITEPENGPVWLLDTAAPEPRLVFVPAAQK